MITDASALPLKLPRPLAENSTLVVWAPSHPVGAYAARLQRGVEALSACGFRVRVDETCYRAAGLAADGPRELAEVLHKHLRDPEVDGLVAALGGWTINSVLPWIDYGLVRESAKALVGYSDVSALLLAVLAKARLVTYHGPAVLPEWGEWGGPSQYTRDAFLNEVSGRSPPAWVAPAYSTDELLEWGRNDSRPRRMTPCGAWRAYKHGVGLGQLIGGCLTTLALQMGTPYMPALDGSVLFVEDEELTPDRFLALMESMRQRGAFSGLAGLIVGRPSRPRAMRNGFDDFVAALDIVLREATIPVALDVDIGHTEPMLTLPIGATAELRCDDDGVHLARCG